MKQSRARMCQALLLYGCFFTAPFYFGKELVLWKRITKWDRNR